MLLDHLYNMKYDFQKLPAEVIEHIRYYVEMREKTGGNCDQKLGVLDLAIFNLIRTIDPKDVTVLKLVDLTEMDKKTDSNNGFNTKGLVDLGADDILKLEKVDDMLDLSDSTQSQIHI